MKWIVPNSQSGLKLIAFVKAKLPEEISARQIKRWIETGACTINNQVERFASRSVGNGDQIILNAQIDRAPLSSLPVDLLYIDDHLLAYNKPSGLNSDSPQLLTLLSGYAPLTLLHRLDKQTTGILLFARSSEMAEKMLTLFKQREISKKYRAIVDGVPKKKEGVIENYLGKLSSYQGQTIWGSVSDKKGVFAQTNWKVQKSGKEASLIECRPKTGRTHQLRVHLSEMGYPILGDHQYGRTFRCSFRPQRIMLHATEITFIHPITQTKLSIISPLPQDFQETIDRVL